MGTAAVPSSSGTGRFLLVLIFVLILPSFLVLILLVLPSQRPAFPWGQLFAWHHTPAFQGNTLLWDAALHWTSLTADAVVPFPATPCKPDIRDYLQEIRISPAPRRTRGSVADGAPE